MKNNIKLIIPFKYSLCYLLILLPFWTFSQVGAGSVYSIYGIGELNPTTSIQSRGMGYTSIGVSNPYSINLINPAANGVAATYFNHVFDMGLYHASTTYESKGNTENSSYGGFSNFNFWFRFGKKWNGSFGLSKVSNVGYNITKDDVNSFQNGAFDIIYEGQGGLNDFYFSNGFAVTKNLSLGLKLSLIFGTIEKSEEVNSNQKAQQFFVENNASILTLVPEYSLNYKISGSKHYWNIGIIYKPSTTMSGETKTEISELSYDTYGNAIGGSLYLDDDYEKEYKLPQRVGLGLSFNTPKVILAADLEFNEWSRAYLGEDTDVELTNTWRYSMGIEVTPNRYGDVALGRFSYRVGGYFENQYLKVNGTAFNKYGITGGIGIPVKSNTIDMAYHRKLNGTIDNGLIYESTNEISLNVTFRQKWFQRRKYN